MLWLLHLASYLLKLGHRFRMSTSFDFLSRSWCLIQKPKQTVALMESKSVMPKPVIVSNQAGGSEALPLINIRAEADNQHCNTLRASGTYRKTFRLFSSSIKIRNVHRRFAELKFKMKIENEERSNFKYLNSSFLIFCIAAHTSIP